MCTKTGNALPASQQWRARVFEYIQDFDFGLAILNNIQLCQLKNLPKTARFLVSRSFSMSKVRESMDFIILEKAGGVGGTWRENTYPGAECDIPSALYSYSFAPNPTWDFKWAKQPQILKYLQDFAQDRDLLRHVKFGKMVTGADYEDGRWTIKTKSGESFDCQFFVSAIANEALVVEGKRVVRVESFAAYRKAQMALLD